MQIITDWSDLAKKDLTQNTETSLSAIEQITAILKAYSEEIEKKMDGTIETLIVKYETAIDGSPHAIRFNFAVYPKRKLEKVVNLLFVQLFDQPQEHYENKHNLFFSEHNSPGEWAFWFNNDKDEIQKFKDKLNELKNSPNWIDIMRKLYKEARENEQNQE